MLGIAGVALGSYAAYAGNSATMTVTATIAHDVSLRVIQDLNLGTITINPSIPYGYFTLDDYVFNLDGGVISVTGASSGIYTANTNDMNNFGYAVSMDEPLYIDEVISDYADTPNTFYVGLSLAYDEVPAEGSYEGEIEITYYPR